MTRVCGFHSRSGQYRNDLFDALPDLFDPPFTMASEDFNNRRTWTNGVTRRAASAAEAEQRAATSEQLD